MSNSSNIRKLLESMSEESYRRFSASLLPGVDRILGVRLPAMRRLAKQIAANDWRTYLKTAQRNSFEEIMLQGMVIGYLDAPADERLQWIANFLPSIDNWSVCDSFCSGLKFVRQNRQEVWDFLQKYIESQKEFEVRFAVVMLLDHYICDEYIDAVLCRLNQVVHPGYYAKMAVAWAAAECYAAYTEKTWKWLCCTELDAFTLRKTVQKISESRKVGFNHKMQARRLIGKGVDTQ